MKFFCLIQKSIRKERKLTEHEYHKYRPRKVPFSEHVYFVQICPVFAGPVTYIFIILMHIPIAYIKLHVIHTYISYCFILEVSDLCIS